MLDVGAHGVMYWQAPYVLYLLSLAKRSTFGKKLSDDLRPC